MYESPEVYLREHVKKHRYVERKHFLVQVTGSSFSNMKIYWISVLHVVFLSHRQINIHLAFGLTCVTMGVTFSLFMGFVEVTKIICFLF